jgi:hypothetical protein
MGRSRRARGVLSILGAMRSRSPNTVLYILLAYVCTLIDDTPKNTVVSTLIPA